MSLLQRRLGPYAPRRQLVNFAEKLMAAQAAAAAARVEQERTEQEAIAALRATQLEADPLTQLVRRAYHQDQAISALRVKLAGVEMQLKELTNLMRGAS